MNLNKKTYLTFFILFFIHNALVGQNSKDTLQRKTFIELINLYNKDKNNRENYVKAIISNAKTKKDTFELMVGYDIYTLHFDDDRKLLYCDSIINISKHFCNKEYPARAYRLKGLYYYKKRNFKKAFDNHKKALFFAKKYPNKNLFYSCKYSIAILKARIGEYDEALKIFQYNYLYAKNHFRSRNITKYLNSIFAIANTLNGLKKYDSAFYYNNLGAMESNIFKKVRNYHHFALNQGVTQYYLQNYKAANDSIEKHLAYFTDVKDKPNMAIGYFFKGKIYQNTNKVEKAIFYYKKVDTIFQQINDIHPKTRESYEYLINYYKKKKNLKKQLYYVQQLLKVDSVLYGNTIYLKKHILKEYDFPLLLEEKRNIIEQLNIKEKKLTLHKTLLFIIILLIIGILLYQYRQKKIYQEKFHKIINNTQNKASFKKKPTKIKLNDSMINSILLHLENFEKNNEYLSQNITLHNLAKKLGTNSNYLSKIINSHKGMSFAKYLNELRIYYAVEQLKINPTFRKYTIKAIANEVGFNRAESFSNAFNKIVGIKPSFFIKQFEKNYRNS